MRDTAAQLNRRSALSPVLTKPKSLARTFPTQLLDAQAELQSVRDAAAQREAELREQVAALRREKRELEARAGGVDLGRIEVRKQA